MQNTILGQPIPPFADSAEFGDFVQSIYQAAGNNYLSASRVLKCDPMTVWRLVSGKQKDSPKLRKIWGIHYRTQPVAVCPIHGKVHKFDCQTEQVQPLKPRQTAVKARNRRPYKSFDPTDPAQVQRQIERYMPGYKLVKDE